MVENRVVAQGSPAATRRERERQARMHRILQAATHVFARRGYHGATMEQIARHADLGKTTIYYYVATKKQLYKDLVESAIIDLVSMVDEVPFADGDDLDVSEALCSLALQYFSADPDRAALLLPLMAGGAEKLADLLGTDVAFRMVEAHRPLFRHFAGAGGPQPSPVFAQLLGSLILGQLTRFVFGGPGQAEVELAQFFAFVRRARASDGEN